MATMKPITVIAATRDQIADAFNEWLRRYEAEPDAFESGYGAVGDYGTVSADYLISILEGRDA
jgi:hypothetical protein